MMPRQLLGILAYRWLVLTSSIKARHSGVVSAPWRGSRHKRRMSTWDVSVCVLSFIEERVLVCVGCHVPIVTDRYHAAITLLSKWEEFRDL